MSDDKKEKIVGEPGTVTTHATGKPLERLQLTVEFDKPMDHAALAEVIDAVKLYGSVTVAKHTVLRRHSRELV
jgi:hypothetical protein